MNRTRRYAIGAVAIVLVSVVAITFSEPSVQIRYHLWAMGSFHKRIYATPSVVSPEGLVGYGSQELFDRHDFHRDRLVELGYYFHARYETENLPHADGVHSTLARLVWAAFPDSQHPTLSHPENVLEVWDLSIRQKEWGAFVEKHNVADFVERFMAKTDAKSQ